MRVVAKYKQQEKEVFVFKGESEWESRIENLEFAIG